MSDGMDSGRQVFLGEAREIIEELESAILQMEESPEDGEPVGRVFRAMHTLKGSGAMFGFDDISSFTHEIESYYDLVRSGNLAVTKGLADLTFKSLDQIRAMLDACSGGEEADASKTDEIVSSFRQLAGAPGVTASEPAADAGAARSGKGDRLEAPAAGEEASYDIWFRPPDGVMLDGTNPIGLLDQLRALGNLTVTADTSGIPCLDDMDPEKCYTGWYALLTTRHGVDEIRDVFIFVEEDSEISIRPIEGISVTEGEFGHKLLGDLLIEKGDVRPEAVEAALREKKRLGEILLEMGEVEEDGLRSALAEQNALDARWRQKSAESIRVASDKLDVLADLVGEMVTVQARLRRVASSSSDSELVSVSEEMDKLTETLRDNTLSMRMVPFGSTFTKFKRLVRDLARDLGKDVVFATKGGETELDKTVIERLNDPIMHLVRNCIDHGIEPPEERARGGKRRQGKVSLEAVHTGGKVLIRITDDGRGLDPGHIRRVAVERGVLRPEDTPSDKELFELTLSAGFSTAENVSSVSGRGVGLDVVKKAIDTLRGTIEISSAKGQGTAITLVLPLTLAIIEGLLVTVDDVNYVMPLNGKNECLERVNKRALLGGIGDFMDVRGELVPCVRLRDFFGIEGEPPEIEHVVVMEDEGSFAGVAVDRVVGEHQAVIKPLSRVCSGAEGVSGATILGDGRVALILDMAEIVRLAQRDNRRAPKAA